MRFRSLEDIPKHLQDQVASQLFTKHNAIIKAHNFTPDPVLECSSGNEPLAKDKAKKADSGVYRVGVVSFRCRLLDMDNLCGKFHVDALRYSGLLPSDAPQFCHITISQVKVKTKAEQRTEITIEIP